MRWSYRLRARFARRLTDAAFFPGSRSSPRPLSPASRGRLEAAVRYLAARIARADPLSGG